MAERASLKRQIDLVNRGAALTALFLLASCSDNTSKKPDPVQKSDISAPIIWQTPRFEDNLNGFAISDMVPVRFLVASASAGISITDADGTPLGEPGSYTASELGQGISADFGGATLRLFPGIDERSGALVLYAHGDGLLAPNDVAVSGIPTSGVAGLCSGPASVGDGLGRLAYWTTLDNSKLIIGNIVLEDNQLTFRETASIKAAKYITSCGIDRDFVVLGGGFGLTLQAGNEEDVLVDTPAIPLSISVKAIASGGLAFAALSSNEVFIFDAEGKNARIQIQPGLSSQPPETIGQIAITSNGTVGSLPNGFLAIESELRSGSQILFLDLKTISDQL